MSRSGHDAFAVGAVLVGSFRMPASRRFEEHVHRWHQLAWAAEGVLLIEASGRTWVMPPSQALWIPGGVAHTTSAHGLTVMRSLYFRPDDCRITWPEPTVIAVRPLLRELVVYLADLELAARARERAEAVVLDLLTPVRVTALELPMPRDGRARRVAEALLADPADDRGLPSWGRAAGASGRTLNRLFAAETGMSFGRWRTQARLVAALGHLAAGRPVTAVAHQVGYSTPSAFIAVFRRTLGVSPGAYSARFGSGGSGPPVDG